MSLFLAFASPSAYMPTHPVAAVRGSRFAVSMAVPGQGSWTVPGPPKNFDGAQWAPWEFGTTMKPAPDPSLRVESGLAYPVSPRLSKSAPANNIVEAPVAVPAKEELVAAVAAAPAAAAPAVAAAAPAPAPAAPAAAPGTFKVTLQTPEGDLTLDCPPNVYLLDHTDELAEEEGNEAFADLPYACRAGSCSACAAKVISGEVDNSDGGFLSDEQKANGYVLTCTSYIKSDAVLKMHAEDDLY